MKRLVLLCSILLASVLFSACTVGKKAKSGLQVITDGTEASVFLNDTYVEKTPFINRELSPGDYRLKIQPDNPDLIPYETEIRLRPGLLTVVTWKLAERPEFSGGVIYEMEPITSKTKSEISFVTIPDGAIVSVAGKEKTFSPVIIADIAPGHTEFEVSLPSYESQKHTINAVPGYRMLVTVKLSKVNLNGTTVPPTESDTEVETATQSATSSAQTQQPAAQNPVTPAANPVSATPVATTSAVGREAGTVQITSTNFFIEGKEVLRVRSQPNSTGSELGFAEVGSTHQYIEIQNNWYNITFNGQSGWVSGQYAQVVQ